MVNKKGISILLVALLVFMFMPINLAKAQSESSLNFELDKDSFNVEEKITGEGQVKNGEIPMAGVEVTLTVEDNTGLSLFKVGQYITDVNGKFNINFRLPSNMNVEKYVVKVKALGKEVTKEFQIVGKDKPTEPTVPDKPTKPDEPTIPTKPEDDKKDSYKTIEQKSTDYGKLIVVEDKDGKIIGKVDIDEKNFEKQIKDDRIRNILIKIETEKELDKISVNFKPNAITGIVESKKSLEISSDYLTCILKPNTFKDIKDCTVEFKMEKKDKKIGKEYIQTSPLIELQLNAMKGGKIEEIKISEKPILSMKYDYKSGINYEKACLYRVDEKDNIIFKGGKLDKTNKTLETEIDKLGEYAVLIYDKTFKDVDAVWAKEPVEVLVSRHIIDGIDEENFAPKGNITRAEFCKMIINSLNIGAGETDVKFKDVDNSDSYFEFINIAASLGITEGHDGMFEPNEEITREAVVTMIYRLLKSENYIKDNMNVELTFDDSKDISNWAKEAVLFAKENGIIEGVGNNRFEPKRNATRAELSVMIYRMLKSIKMF